MIHKYNLSKKKKKGILPGSMGQKETNDGVHKFEVRVNYIHHKIWCLEIDS